GLDAAHLKSEEVGGRRESERLRRIDRERAYARSMQRPDLLHDLVRGGVRDLEVRRHDPHGRGGTAVRAHDRGVGTPTGSDRAGIEPVILPLAASTISHVRLLEASPTGM